jgi:hypothetical protein
LRCRTCHDNAGAKSFFTTDNGTVVQVGDPMNFTLANGNFDTGVEAFLTTTPTARLPRPIDGGFGTQPQGMPPPGGPFNPIPNADGSFGDRSFNTPAWSSSPTPCRASTTTSRNRRRWIPIR